MRRLRVWLAATLAASAALAFAAQADAVVFTVDSTAGTADPGINGDCDVDPSADDDCTLVAAVQEANATAAADAIGFNKTDNGSDPDDVTFVGGQNPAEVTISGTPPTITHPLTVNGGNCAFAPSDRSPCAIVGGGWVIDSDGEVSILGLAFSNSSGIGTAIEVAEVNGTSPSVPDFRLQNAWFGINTLGTTAGTTNPGTSVLLEDVDGALIGGDPTVGPNIFARHDAGGAGVDILGADNTEISNNLFGVLPDGTFARAGQGSSSNGDNIEVTGNTAPTPDDPSIGTLIGISDAPLAATPACDGGCNLILGAGAAENADQLAAAIDLDGESGQGEMPADGARIVGNHIGQTNGVTTDPQNTQGIQVGDADNVQIGGPAADSADRNLITASGVASDTGATGLVVQNNVVRGTSLGAGLSLRGSGQVLDNFILVPGEALAITFDDTSSPNFTVQGNSIGEDASGNPVDTGVEAIRLNDGANGNLIGGAGVGDGNRIIDIAGDAPSTGIRIAGDNNVVRGNTIGVGSDGSAHALLDGIAVTPDQFDPSREGDNNTIGGTTALSENVISNVTGDAIVITDPDSDGNLIERNRGAANGQEFIDLGDDGLGNLAEPNGTNAGAQAPVISIATANSATGTAAAGATVRVFTKANGSAGELEGFLGAATANGSGSWTLPYGTQSDGRLLAATATVASNTSELSAAEAVDAAAPQTTIESGPADGSFTADTTPTFTFSASEEASIFECRIDGAAFAACGGPGTTHTAAALTDGPHTFEVRATDAAGNVEATPPARSFTVDTIAPETTIEKAPKKRSFKRKATFVFSAAEPNSSFECRLDRGNFEPCGTRAKFRVKPKKHKLAVRATDAAGNTDRSPALAKWKVKRRHK